jgi:hypothetical protein
MISVSLDDDDAKLVRLALALLYHGIGAGEHVAMSTILAAFETAGVQTTENPLGRAQPAVLATLIEKFKKPEVR